MNNKGFTIVELLFVIVWLAALSVGGYITYLIIRALLKYIGS